VDVKAVETFGFRQLHCLLDLPDAYRQTLVEITAAENRSGFAKTLLALFYGARAIVLAPMCGQMTLVIHSPHAAINTEEFYLRNPVLKNCPFR
jgi:hypothetical protein